MHGTVVILHKDILLCWFSNLFKLLNNSRFRLADRVNDHALQVKDAIEGFLDSLNWRKAGVPCFAMCESCLVVLFCNGAHCLLLDTTYAV